MASFVAIGRSLMYDLALPPPGVVAYAVVWTAAAAVLARLVFTRWGRDINEAI